VDRTDPCGHAPWGAAKKTTAPLEAWVVLQRLKRPITLRAHGRSGAFEARAGVKKKSAGGRWEGNWVYGGYIELLTLW